MADKPLTSHRSPSMNECASGRHHRRKSNPVKRTLASEGDSIQEWKAHRRQMVLRAFLAQQSSLRFGPALRFFASGPAAKDRAGVVELETSQIAADAFDDSQLRVQSTKRSSSSPGGIVRAQPIRIGEWSTVAIDRELIRRQRIVESIVQQHGSADSVPVSYHRAGLRRIALVPSALANA